MAEKDFNPILAASPPEIPLSNAPLVRVISQVRFPIIASIEKRDFIGSFQEAIREKYPILRNERSQQIIIGPEATEPLQTQTIWRFSDTEGKWRASLAPEFVSLETSKYTSRSDFLERFQDILKAVNTNIQPKQVDRLGIRYIDRITGDQVNKIDELVRQEMLGIIATPLKDFVQHLITESLFEVPSEKAQMLVRWGKLPPEATFDPGAIEPSTEPSWILDIDMFCARPSPFNPDNLICDARKYAERIYTFFRWAVREAFLKQYGGKL